MSNIIEIAKERRAMLLDEIGQLDCFIEMAAQSVVLMAMVLTMTIIQFRYVDKKVSYS